VRFRDRQQRGQRYGADMQHTDPMNVVELETLDLRPVDQRGMWRRQF